MNEGGREEPGPPPGPGRDLIDLFARLRDGKSLTNSQLARRADISESYLSEILGRKKTPRPDVAARIAHALSPDGSQDLHARRLAEQAAEQNQYKRETRPVSPPPAAGTGSPSWTEQEMPVRAARWILLRRGLVPLAVAIFIVLAATGVLFDPLRSGSAWITGSATCESRQPVIAVWIAASAGQQESGYAHLGPALDSGLNYPSGSTVTYSYRLPGGGPYVVHVGCGGTSRHWVSANYSTVISSRSTTLRCDDPVARRATSQTLRGACTTGA
jgi:transcriptional regulator with XRE-family HTH domain